MADEEEAKRRNSNRRRISFSEDMVAAQAAEATVRHAEVEARKAEASKSDVAWDSAEKDGAGLLPVRVVAGVLTDMQSEPIPGGVEGFLTTQSYLKTKEAIDKNEFEILCGELEEWLLYTPEQVATAIANAETPEGQLPQSVLDKLTAFFNKLDVDDDKEITKEEAISHWGKNFAKINAEAMFNEVDVDGDGKVTIEEWYAFWENVLRHGYSAEEVEEELDELVEGGSWVDFNDGRNT